MATISKRGNVWRVQVRMAGRYFSESFHSKQAAQQWARAKEDAIRLGSVDQVQAMTLRAAIDRYEMERREHRPLSATIRGNLTRWQESCGAKDLARLTADDVVQHAKQRTCGAATMAMEVGALRDVYTVARTWGIRPTLHPVDEAMPTLRKLRLIARPKERERRPTDGELDRLQNYLAANKRIPMRDLLDFAIASSMRVSEITRITWSDLDSDKRTIIIRDRKDPQAKEGNNQTVPLIGDAFVIVDRQLRKAARIFPHHEESITRCFRESCKALGIIDLHWHDLRHEGISRLFEAGYQIQEVAVVSGHRDWKSLKRYTNLRPESLHRDAMAEHYNHEIAASDAAGVTK